MLCSVHACGLEKWVIIMQAWQYATVQIEYFLLHNTTNNIGLILVPPETVTFLVNKINSLLRWHILTFGFFFWRSSACDRRRGVFMWRCCYIANSSSYLACNAPIPTDGIQFWIFRMGPVFTTRVPWIHICHLRSSEAEKCVLLAWTTCKHH
jgi:hypothetical protein